MTGAGAPGGPGIIKAIQKDKAIELIVCDADINASGRFLNDRFIQIPSADDSDFVPRLKQICIEQNIDLIFPLVTKELLILSQLKTDFSSLGTKILVSDFESLEIANNKSLLCKHLASQSILTPEFRVVRNIDQLKSAFESLDFPNKPLCIKPSLSNGSRGVRIINNSISEFDLLFNQKPNSLYMSYDKLLGILKVKAFPELLVSEYLPGEEFTIDTIVIDGKVMLVLPRIRTKMNGGISVAGQFIKEKEIIDYCHQILDSLKLEGPIGIQVKKAEDGKYKILEINPRIQGTSVAALGLGINLPLLSIYAAFGISKFPNENTIPWGRKFARYYEEVFYD
jgi:carbamoyl-phosphate synthase large subunit